MGYEQIDPVLEAWASSNDLHLSKTYQDEEVRSVEHYIGRREGFQIWIDRPNGVGMVGIHVWDFRKNGRRRDFLVSYNDLAEYLEISLEIAKSWIRGT